jgi:hypothetical protein
MLGDFQTIDALVYEIKKNTNFLSRAIFIGRRALIVIIAAGLILAAKLMFS